VLHSEGGKEGEGSRDKGGLTKTPKVDGFLTIDGDIKKLDGIKKRVTENMRMAGCD